MKHSAVTIRIIQDTSQDGWNSVVKHPLQSWAWGEFRKKMGVGVIRLGVYKGDHLVDGLQITFHSLPSLPYFPHLPYTIGYLPKGPMPTREMRDALEKLGKEKKSIFIQIEPNVHNNNVTMQQYNNVIPSHHPLFPKYTFILDLTKSEAELLKAMHSKTRYNIKLAQKRRVFVKEDNSKDAFEEYLKLNKETTERQGFFAHNETYHRTMWKTLSQGNNPIARLFTAVYQGKTLAGWIVFVWKDTIYYPYGASSREHRDVMAPNLLLWEIMLRAKKQGLKYFDLWGALGPMPTGEPDANDPWYGFHRFKEGYKPDLVEFIGSYDLVISPFLYKLYCHADTLRWSALKISQRLASIVRA